MLKKVGITILCALSGASAQVQMSSMQQTLAPQVAQSRFAVLIPEVILRRPVPDPAAETEIMRALIAAGYRLVDLGNQQKNDTRELLRTQDINALPDIQSRLNADYLITGEAFAEEYGTVAGGLRGYTSRLEVKVIDLASSQVIYSNAFQGSGLGATDAIAGKTALMKVGQQAGQKLPSLLNQVLQGNTTGAHHTYPLHISAPVTFTAVNALTQKLKNSGVKDAVVRAIDSGGALVDVVYDGSVADLATLLENNKLSIVGLTGKEITAKF